MFNVLMVEDNEADVLLMEVALEGHLPELKLHVVADGVEALAFLHGKGRYDKMPRPDLVLMDGNMPRKSAVEVLAEVRSTVALAGLPIVVFSSSSMAADAERSLQAGADAYITKPVGLTEFTEVARSTLAFWYDNLDARKP